MCLSAPVEVLTVDGPHARVRSGGGAVEVSTLGVPGIRPGDWAILSGGVLVRRVDPERAAEIATALGVAAGR